MKTLKSSITLFVLSLALAAGTLFIDGVTSPLMAAPAATGILPNDSVHIQFAPGTTATELTDIVRAGRFKSYVLRAMQGQIMSVSIYQNGILNQYSDVELQIVGADGAQIYLSTDGWPTWTGELPATQDYYIYAVSVGPNNRYRLNVAIEPQHTPPVTPKPVDVERVNFAHGAHSASLSGELVQDLTKQYVLNAQAGQRMDVFVSSLFAPVDFTITAPNGITWRSERLGSEAWVAARTITLPQSGDYMVEMHLPPRTGATEYNIEFTITNRTSPPPVTPPVSNQPERISFARGESATTIEATLPANGQKQYALNARAGQIMEIRVSSDVFSTIDMTMRGPRGTLWNGLQFGLGSAEALLTVALPESGDYIVTLTGDAGVEYTAHFGIANAPNLQDERVRFAAGATASQLTRFITDGSTKRYVLGASAGQEMSVFVSSLLAPVDFTIVAPNGAAWQAETLGSEAHIRARTITLPQSGDYLVILRGATPNGTTKYNIDFTVTNGTTLPPVTPPVATQPERVNFDRGKSAASIAAVMPANDQKQYMLNAQAGQVLDVNISSPIADSQSNGIAMTIRSPRGTVWQGVEMGLGVYMTNRTVTLPESGDYIIALNGSAGEQYTANFTIVDAPTLQDERVRFARGASSAQLSGYMADGGTKRYIIGASAGQKMNITVSSLMAQVGFSVMAPSGATWLSEPLGADVWLSALTITLPQSGDYTVILNTPWENGSTQYNISFGIE